jgi:hypothetical protein
MVEEQKDEDDLKEFREVFNFALELKTKLGLPSVDTALLLIIQQDIDQIRFHNSD